jgi:type IV secretory pathway component VirB8
MWDLKMHLLYNSCQLNLKEYNYGKEVTAFIKWHVFQVQIKNNLFWSVCYNVMWLADRVLVVSIMYLWYSVNKKDFNCYN